MLAWGAPALSVLSSIPDPLPLLIAEGGSIAAGPAPSVVAAGAARRLGRLGRAAGARSGRRDQQRISSAAARVENVEGRLLDWMRNEQATWDRDAIGRAGVRAAGVLIALHNSAVGAVDEWGPGEEAAFAALRRRLVEEEDYWVRALPPGLGGDAAAEAERAGGDPVAAAAAVLVAEGAAWVRKRAAAAKAEAKAAAAAAAEEEGAGVAVKE
jgi:hypothetical protein